MNKDRSPNFPGLSLEEALAKIETVYSAAGRSAVDDVAIVKELGYGSVSGATRKIMGALNGYGLLDRHAGGYRVSDDAIKAIRPTTDSERQSAISRLALIPKVFSEIHQSHRECSESILARTLIHKKFTEDGAQRAAKIYKANSTFANLDSLPQSEEVPNDETVTSQIQRVEEPIKRAKVEGKHASHVAPTAPYPNMLAQYSVPLGANNAQLTFTGETLGVEDFDALIEYVELFKRQFERKAQKDRESQMEIDPETGHPIT